MNYHHDPSKILITGESGTGKTTLFIDLINRSKHRWKFIFDPELEFASRTGQPAARSLQTMQKALLLGRPVVFDSSGLFPGNREEGFDFFCRWVAGASELLRGPKLLATDEVQGVTAPGIYGIPRTFKVICDEGRRREIDVVLISQRPSDVNYVIRCQMTEIYSFQHVDPLQLKALSLWGFDPQKVMTLPVPGGHIRFIKRSRIYETHAKRSTDSSANTPRKKADGYCR